MLSGSTFVMLGSQADVKLVPICFIIKSIGNSMLTNIPSYSQEMDQHVHSENEITFLIHYSITMFNKSDHIAYKIFFIHTFLKEFHKNPELSGNIRFWRFLQTKFFLKNHKS